jgi:hypothetical protein
MDAVARERVWAETAFRILSELLPVFKPRLDFDALISGGDHVPLS